MSNDPIKTAEQRIALAQAELVTAQELLRKAQSPEPRPYYYGQEIRHTPVEGRVSDRLGDTYRVLAGIDNRVIVLIRDQGRFESYSVKASEFTPRRCVAG